jgi:large subunit ribosomal protein L5
MSAEDKADKTDKKDKKAKGSQEPKGKKGGEGKKAEAKKAPGGEAAKPRAPRGPLPVPRIKTDFESRVLPDLIKHFGYRNRMQAPKLTKIVVNMRVGEAVQNVKLVDGAVAELSRITGQHASVRRAKKAIANFKLREGMPIGAAVTLRGRRMYEFYDRFVSVAVPRIRDFRGFSMKSFDGRGNYSVGIQEQIIFPEIDYDKIEKVRGLDITFVTSARTDEEGLELLKRMRFPFRQAGQTGR